MMPVMTEAETEVTQLQVRKAADYWRPPETRKRQGSILPQRSEGKHGPTDT